MLKINGMEVLRDGLPNRKSFLLYFIDGYGEPLVGQKELKEVVDALLDRNYDFRTQFGCFFVHKK